MIRAIAFSMVLAPRIVGGGPSPSSQDATVLLRIGEMSTCTGTLVASNLVLTARHCIEAGETIEVATGAGAREAEPIANGRKIFVPDGGNDGDDIAIVALDRRIEDITPAVVRTTKPEIGERAVAVGYGEDGDGDVPGVRQQRRSIRIDALGPATVDYETSAGDAIRVDVADKMIATGESTCFGDSGGPLFDAEGAVIGVTSSGVDDECRDRPSLFVGTYAFAGLLTRARAETTPGKDLAENTLGVDGASSPSESPGGCSASPSETTDASAIALICVVALACARRRRSAAFVLLVACRSSPPIGEPLPRPSETKAAELPEARDDTGPCSHHPTESSCLLCCNERSPEAVKLYVARFSECACRTPGTCAAECTATYCAGLEASTECKSCLEGAETCDDVARSECWDDAKCRPLLDCARESRCASKDDG
jgi:hypothetical protein